MGKKLFLIFCCIPIFISNILANAIEVSNLVVDAPNQEVTFDLAWKNSWRIDALSSPNNWDAAWVIVKFSECDSLVTNFFPNWEHGKLDTDVSSHNFGNLEPVLNSGIIGISDSLGVMLRRNANGFFTDELATTITLKVSNLNPASTYHLRVIAIEMVYVTEGSFQIGGEINYNSFDSTEISNENAVTITSIAPGADASVNLSANYPKGFAAFHCMKYEISNGQYATFLNSINNTQASNRYYNTASYRHRLTNTGTNQFEKYISDRENRAYNYMGWDDILSYLDWAALRPMTELQYEKACRGLQNTVQNEYAWGTTYINNGYEFTGAENGTEYFIDASSNAVFSNTSFINGDAGRGPARCGIFALPTNNAREQSGATYYGIMEMSGNVWEHCVDVSSFTDIAGSIAYDGAFGDGYVDINGLWNVSTWPLAANGNSLRGGSFSDSETFLRLANRANYLWTGARNRTTGGRGIR